MRGVVINSRGGVFSGFGPSSTGSTSKFGDFTSNRIWLKQDEANLQHHEADSGNTSEAINSVATDISHFLSESAAVTPSSFSTRTAPLKTRWPCVIFRGKEGCRVSQQMVSEPVLLRDYTFSSKCAGWGSLAICRRRHGLVASLLKPLRESPSPAERARILP